MAERAIEWKSSSDVVGIGGTSVDCVVTGIAIGRCTGEYVVGMA